MEPWQLALAAAAGGALLLTSRGDDTQSGGGGGETLPETVREGLYGLPDPPIAIAGEIYGLSEEEISAQLDDYASRLVGSGMFRTITGETEAFLREQLEVISGLVARIYGPDTAYFPPPSNTEAFTGSASPSVLNEILFEISREAYRRQRMYQEGVGFVPEEVENLYTTGALEAEWIGYMRTLQSFLRGKVTEAYRLPEQLYLAPGVGEKWSEVQPFVSRTDRGTIYISAPNYIGLMRSVAGPWYLAPDDDTQRASAIVARLCAAAGERSMAQSVEGLEAGWRSSQGAGRAVLVRKLANAVVYLLRNITESGITIWHFACDQEARSNCPG